MNAPEILKDESAGTQVVPSVSIENLVNQRDAVLERLAQIIDMINETAAIAARANVGFPTFCTSPSHYSRSVEQRINGAYMDRSAEVLEHMRKEVDGAGWQYLMGESGMRSLMDAKAREQWDKQIEGKDMPPLTVDNIRGTFRMLHDSRGEIFERGVINVFKGLAWDYKTNLPQKFGKRIVLTYIRSAVTGPGTSLGWPNMRHCDELDDLMRVFHVLDGKAEPDHRQGTYKLLHMFANTTDPDVENEYVRIKQYKNGAGHVTFKRPDLVDQMNRIIAKHYPGALPEPK